jgi:hypothetical protein
MTHRIPVLSKAGVALTPSHPARIRELLKAGRGVLIRTKGQLVFMLQDREAGSCA